MTKEVIVQRYMNLSKFLYLLQHGSLYLPKMSLFEDHLEGGLTANDYLDKTNELGIIDLATNSYWPKIQETEEERNKRLEDANLKHRELREQKFDTPFGRFLKEDVRKNFPTCREWIYVSCWHLSEFESSAMWQLYGVERNSICIFTTVEKLSSQIVHDDTVDTIKLENVHYLDHATAKFGSDPLKPFISKALPFSFEKEIRIVALNSKVDLVKSTENEINGINIKINPLSKLIDKIVISPNAESWFKECVQNLCNQYGLNIAVETSSLKRERIETMWCAITQHQENGL
jgi:hypothetical protein